MCHTVLVACVLLLTVIENVISTEKKQAIGETLDDARVRGEFVAMYNEMLNTNENTVRNIKDNDVFGFGTDLTRLKGMAERRRSSRMSSAVKNRRVRSQALRREKLNSQSLRSHMEHSRQSSFEQRMQ